MKAIINGIILAEEGEHRGKALLFDEKVRGIVPIEDLDGQERIDATGQYVAPGLVDVHIHGYLGDDTSDGSEEGVRRIARGILANGVTSFLPTTMTVRWDEIEQALQVVRRLMPLSREPAFDGAQILGAHAEGPFINPLRKGAQAADHILDPDAARVLPHQDVIKIITMAPEMPGGIDFIRRVTKESGIVVSIGHTSASFEQALEAIQAGASHITHLFNAMTGLNHRDPGVVGAALTTDVASELISDNFHINPSLYSLLVTLKGDKLVLVTDCTRAGGLPDGEYSLGGQPIFVKGIACRLKDGTIAGSVLHLNDAVRNLKEHTHLSLRDAVHAASLNAAACIGMGESKGSLKVGKDADIILMDENCQVAATYVGGTLKYKKQAGGNLS
ncbi:MAG: N-acetylglucosamine-6-phosphate deacetylase [Christensenellales bacterium]